MPFSKILNEMRTIDRAYVSLEVDEQKKRERRLAFWIGVSALGLAPLVLILDNLIGESCLRPSISAYFYEPSAGPFFVALLIFVGAFLIRYRGENIWDGRLATIAAYAAVTVALIPTSISKYCTAEAAGIDMRTPLAFNLVEGNATLRSDLVDSVAAGALSLFSSPDSLHFGAAIILLIILFYFAFIAFTRVREGDRGPDGEILYRKRFRNLIYYLASAGMVASFAIMLLYLLDIRTEPVLGLPAVFFGEALALASFGVAWLVKGRFWFGWLDSSNDPKASPQP